MQSVPRTSSLRTRLPISAEPAPRTDAWLTGEHLLAAAILRQAIVDARSALPWLSRPAREFLEDTPAMQFWFDVLNLPDTAWHHVAAALHGSERGEAWPEQLVLFAGVQS